MTRALSPADAVRASTFAVDVRAAAVHAALAEHGIDAILVKGAGLADWLYPDEPRMYGDVDLLLDPAEVDRAGAVLERRGYRKSPFPAPGDHADCYHAPAGARRIAVDLHRSFHFLAAPPERVWAVLGPRRRMLTVADRELPTLDEPACALFVALHRLRHAGHTQQGEDLRRALGNDCWDEAADLARELDCVAALSTALRTEPGGILVADRLGLAVPDDPALALAAAPPVPTAAGALALAQQDGLRAKARLLRAELIPPRAQMVEHIPLARRPRGLPAAHLLRLATIARHLPAGLRAARKVRRPPAL